MSLNDIVSLVSHTVSEKGRPVLELSRTDGM